jgi:serine/threonine-protein kinase
VDSFPVDESVYGVRGLAGNVGDWCADRYRREGPPTDGEVVASPEPHDGVLLDDASAGSDAVRVLRGGEWSGAARRARAAYRSRAAPNLRLENLGFRLVYRPVTSTSS